ncbi:MAG: hypothetical protein IPP40_00305 [bacterium]|nr:hypothetical protein [bacterium]
MTRILSVFNLLKRVGFAVLFCQGQLRAEVIVDTVRGFDMSVQCQRDTFLFGEDIWLFVHLTDYSGESKAPSNIELLRNITIHSNRYSIATNYPDLEIVGEVFTDTTIAVQLNRVLYTPSEGLRDLYPLLLPGSYRGTLGYNNISGDFHFVVADVPDTLESTWAEISELERVRYAFHGSENARDIATLRKRLDAIFQLPRNHPWKVESAYTLVLLISRSRDAVGEDTLNCKDLLLSISEEPYVVTPRLIDTATRLFRAKDGKFDDAGFRTFARQVSRPDALQYAEFFISRVQKVGEAIR